MINKHLFKSKDKTIEFRSSIIRLKELDKFDDEEIDKSIESQIAVTKKGAYEFKILITKEKIIFIHKIELDYDETESRTTIILDPTIRNKQIIYVDEFKLSYFFENEILKVEVGGL